MASDVSFTCDATGNLTGDGRRTLTYDAENQLSSVIDTNDVGNLTLVDYPSGTADITDCDGQRLHRLTLECKLLLGNITGDGPRTLLRWLLVLIFANLQDVCRAKIEESDLERYKSTNRAVKYNDVPVFKIAEDKIDESFKGPILINDSIVIVLSVHNRILVFGGGGKLKREIEVPVRTPRMFYPDRPLISVVVNLNAGLLLYNTDGKTFLLGDSLKLKRMKRLEFDPNKHGNPSLFYYQRYTNSVLQIPCSLRVQQDHEVVVNLKSMKIEYQGEARQR